MKRLLAMLVLGALVAGMFGCETVKGFGRDLEKAGDAIEKSAD